jgi:hypothetical protein
MFQWYGSDRLYKVIRHTIIVAAYGVLALAAYGLVMLICR